MWNVHGNENNKYFLIEFDAFNLTSTDGKRSTVGLEAGYLHECCSQINGMK